MTSKNQHEWAILDSGASSTFLLSQAPVRNAQVATKPLHIKLPNGTTIQSSHIAELALPQLPQQARLAHIVPSLASHSLVSVVKLCNAGCKVMINDISCEIHYRGKPVIKCSKCTNTGLWMMPLLPAIPQDMSSTPSPLPTVNGQQQLPSNVTLLHGTSSVHGDRFHGDSSARSRTTEQAFHVHQSSTKTQAAQFYHQSLFSPPVVTLRNAIQNHQLDSFPGLIPSLLKHLPPSTATAKGHMHKNRKGIRSTRSQTQAIKKMHVLI